jgi:hypothetical protein
MGLRIGVPTNGVTYENRTYTNEDRRAVDIGQNEYAEQENYYNITLRNITINKVRPRNQATTYRGKWKTNTEYLQDEWVIHNDNPYRVLFYHVSSVNPFTQTRPDYAGTPQYATAQPVCNGIAVFGYNYLVENITMTDVAASVSDCEGYYQKARHSRFQNSTLINAGSHQAAVAHKGAEEWETDNPQGFDNDIYNIDVQFTDEHNALCAAFDTKTSGYFAQCSDLRYDTIKCKRANDYAIYSSIRQHNDLSYTNVTVTEHQGEVAGFFQHTGSGLSVDGISIDGANTGIVVSPANASIVTPSLTGISIKNMTGNPTTGVVLEKLLGTVTLENIPFPVVIKGFVQTLTVTNCPQLIVMGGIGTLNGSPYVPTSSQGSTSGRLYTRLNRPGIRTR